LYNLGLSLIWNISTQNTCAVTLPDEHALILAGPAAAKRAC